MTLTRDKNGALLEQSEETSNYWGKESTNILKSIVYIKSKISVQILTFSQYIFIKVSIVVVKRKCLFTKISIFIPQKEVYFLKIF